ncbi:MAG TPA: hypothetical protein PKY50_04260 [Candidatus Competibacter sp.]|nr:hypothetical protein [Candidatus Competibacter sp.]
MNKLTAAVAVTLGASAVVVSTAQADEILFPYVVGSSTVTTLVSVINNADLLTSSTTVPKLHYRYWYKSGSGATDNSGSCVEVDRSLPSSPNDIVTFDTTGQFGGNNLGIVFEKAADATAVDPSLGYGKSSFALLKGVSQPVRAFLLVDNNDFVAASSDENLAGEAIVLEFQNGAAWGYHAYNSAGRYNGTSRFNFFDFSDYVETTGEVLAGEIGEGVVPVALAPFTATGGEFLTKFFVTPIAPSRFDATDNAWIAPGQTGTALGTLPSQNRGDLNARIRLVIEDLDLGTAAIYDRDEQPISGQVPQNVVCVGAVNAVDMLTQGALLQVPDGGWSNVYVSAGTTANMVSTSEAVVIKLEYNEEAPLKLDTDKDSPTVKGITNNAFWLRKGIKESIPRTNPIQLSQIGNDINVTSSVAAP